MIPRFRNVSFHLPPSRTTVVPAWRRNVFGNTAARNDATRQSRACSHAKPRSIGKRRLSACARARARARARACRLRVGSSREMPSFIVVISDLGLKRKTARRRPPTTIPRPPEVTAPLRGLRAIRSTCCKAVNIDPVLHRFPS